MKLTGEFIKEAYAAKDYVYFDNNKSYNLNLFGFRNQSIISNHFDDIIGLSYRDNSLKEKFLLFEGTTDPGTYWLNHPLNSKGTAILVPAQYRSTWQIAKHQGKYEALCQRKPVKVYRDNDKDNELDFEQDTINTGIFGINIHRSNPYTESYYVDKWSAGCQVFKKVADFNKFMNLCRTASKIYGNSFTYTLFDMNDF